MRKWLAPSHGRDRKCRSQRDYASHASPADDKWSGFARVAIVRHADIALHKHRDINSAIRCHEADNDEHGSDQNAVRDRLKERDAATLEA